METRKAEVLKELLLHDPYINYVLGSLIILSILLFINVPQSLELILMIFLGLVCIMSLPFAFYRINNALYLAKSGVEITSKSISIEHGFLGTKLKFEYEYAGIKYNTTKSYNYIWFPDKKSSQMKLLIDPHRPSNYTILKLAKSSVITLIRNRNI